MKKGDGNGNVTFVLKALQKKASVASHARKAHFDTTNLSTKGFFEEFGYIFGVFKIQVIKKEQNFFLKVIGNKKKSLR